LCKPAQRIPNVAKETIEAECRVFRIDALFHHNRIAEAKPGIAHGFFRRHAFSDVGFDTHPQMLAELGFDIAIEARTAGKSEYATKKSHDSPHAKRRLACTPLTTCCQFFSRSASCFLPAAVSE